MLWLPNAACKCEVCMRRYICCVVLTLAVCLFLCMLCLCNAPCLIQQAILMQLMKCPFCEFAGAMRPRDPFHAISPADLRQAILDELQGHSGLSAMDVSRLIWPPPGSSRELNRSHMKNKVKAANCKVHIHAYIGWQFFSSATFNVTDTADSTDQRSFFSCLHAYCRASTQRRVVPHA